MKKVIKKGLNNSGMKTKQYYSLHLDYPEPTLLIKRYVLTNKFVATMKPIKFYKGYILYFSCFAIHVDKLQDAIKELTE